MIENKEKITGLNSVEAQKLLKLHGLNEVTKKKKTSIVLIFLKKLKNPILLLMIIISTVSLFMGQKVSAILMLSMVFVSIILDFINSYKSERAVEALEAQVSVTVTVIRDGSEQNINIKQIVPGDIVVLSAGNIVPADCRIIESDDLYVSQSALTGESIPIEKSASRDINKNTTNQELSTDDSSIVFMGTSIVSGFGLVEVLNTGINTEFGKIAVDLNKEDPKTDFEKSISKFSYFVMKVIFFMVSFVFIVFLFKNIDNLNKNIFLEIVAFALAITIGVTPDMLPAIMTLCLAKGSSSMAKKDVIVKHLSSIENFGSMDILCTDKTGTLTQDKITLVKYLDYNGQENKNIIEIAHLSSHFHTGIANPLDQAINDYKDIDVSAYQKIDEIPYDFERKRSSMVVNNNNKRLLITKGAPEEIIKICNRFELDGKIGVENNLIDKITSEFKKLSSDGFRVLAVAYKELDSDSQITSYDKSVEQEMVFMGFLAFLDPPKEDVTKVIEELKDLGIEIKILTGDNDLLTQKICRDIKMEVKGTLTGPEISHMDDLELTRRVLDTTIFARVNPRQKERVILILKKMGKSVGYMGDGINDATALKTADIGISVNNATDIAKETASIILMQKSLESLKEGVIEGRKTFRNTTKYVLMGLSSNFGNMFSMMGASIFLPFLPMLPAQVLYNNFLYDIGQLTLPTDKVDSDDLLRPTHWDIKFIRNYMIVFGLMSSIFDFLTFWLLYYVYHLSNGAFQNGWLIESIATQTLVIYIIRTKKIPFLQSSPSKALFFTTLLSVLIAWTTQFTPLGQMLGLTPLPVNIMLIIIGYVAVYLVLVEIVKHFFYAHYRNKELAEK